MMEYDFRSDWAKEREAGKDRAAHQVVAHFLAGAGIAPERAGDLLDQLHRAGLVVQLRRDVDRWGLALDQIASAWSDFAYGPRFRLPWPPAEELSKAGFRVSRLGWAAGNCPETFSIMMMMREIEQEAADRKRRDQRS